MSITTGHCEVFKFDEFSKITTVLLFGDRLSGLQPANIETSSHQDPAAFIKIVDINFICLYPGKLFFFLIFIYSINKYIYIYIYTRVDSN